MGATARNVDFSGVKDGGNFNRNRIPAGDYLAIISKVEDAKAKDGIDQYLFSIKIKNRPSSVFPYYCKLQENQLWKLRNLFIAAGKTVPKKRMKVDPNQIAGKLIGVSIEDDEYDGKEQSQISGVFPAAELGDDENLTTDDASVEDDDDDSDDDIAPGPQFEADEEEEEEEPEAGEADDLAGLSRNDLKARIRELKSDFVVKKSMTDDDLRDTLTDLIADSAEPEEADEEEEEAPKPKAKRGAKPKAADLSDDELDELDIDDL